MKKYKAILPEITLKYKSGVHKKAKISKSSDAAEIMREFFNQDTLELTESFIVLYLSKQNNTIGWIKISQGGISGTVVDIRLIFATALKCAASSLIIAHNHPSGNLKPSSSDINITKKIKEAGKLFDIELLDHLIFSSDSYLSMSDDAFI
jgi:DNA repair protein RadC